MYFWSRSSADLSTLVQSGAAALADEAISNAVSSLIL